MAAKLPLRIKMQLRDLWEDRNSPAQKAITELEASLLVRLEVDLSVDLLWYDLSKFYPSQEPFVPALIGLFQAWAVALQLRLDGEDYEDWSDELLNRLDKIRVLRVQVLPASAIDRARTAIHCDSSGAFFRILIPVTKPLLYSTEAGFADDFSKLFEQASTETLISSTNDTQTKTTLSESLPQRHPPISSSQAQQISQSKPSSLPSLDTLPRPEILLAGTPPYHILVEVLSDRIKIMGSHEASLDLLCGYLKKWMRNARDMAPNTSALKIEFKESNFGYGVLRDCIVLERTNPMHKFVELNPAIVLAFVEGVLGYGLVERGAATGRWHFRREEKFVGP